MLIPSFDEIKEITDSRYALVLLVSKRAKKLVDGAEPFVKTKSKKPVSIALEEIMDKKIVFGEPMSNKDYEAKIKEEKERKLEIIRANKLKELEKEEKEAE